MSDANAHLDPLVHLPQPDHPDARADARARLGRAIRDLGHAVVGHEASTDDLLRAAAAVEQLSARFDLGRARHRDELPPYLRPRVNEDPPGEGEVMRSHDERPISGRASPWGLDVEIVREGMEAVGRVTLRSAHEGAPGRSHGGLVAALFDDVYGFVLAIHLQLAFTGELSIRYEAPTPIGRPLECRTRLVGRERRKMFMTGELLDDGAVIARSTATFISIPRELFLGLEPDEGLD